MSDQKIMLNCRIDPEIQESLDRICGKLGISKSDIVRNMLREMIPKYDRTANLFASDLGNAVMRAMLAGDADAQMTLRDILDRNKEGTLPITGG